MPIILSNVSLDDMLVMVMQKTFELVARLNHYHGVVMNKSPVSFIFSLKFKFSKASTVSTRLNVLI